MSIFSKIKLFRSNNNENSKDINNIIDTSDNSSRELHGALLDAELLAQVYLRMTMGQTTMSNLLEDNESSKSVNNNSSEIPNHQTKIIKATKEEIELHQDYFSQ